MSRKPETVFSQRIKDLKKLNKSYYFQAIETTTSRGVADLFTELEYSRREWSKLIGMSR
jgi:hypothetical protein